MPADDGLDLRRRVFQAVRRKRLSTGLNALVDKMTTKTSVIEARKEIIYRTLQELREPVSRNELRELLGWSESELPQSGDLDPLSQLIWEGKVGKIATHRWFAKYFADPDITSSLVDCLPRHSNS